MICDIVFTQILLTLDFVKISRVIIAATNRNVGEIRTSFSVHFENPAEQKQTYPTSGSENPLSSTFPKLVLGVGTRVAVTRRLSPSPQPPSSSNRHSRRKSPFVS